MIELEYGYIDPQHNTTVYNDTIGIVNDTDNLSAQQIIQKIKDCCVQGDYFNPEQVGLDSCFLSYEPTLNIAHRIFRLEHIKDTDEVFDITLSANQLLEKFERANKEGWILEASIL